MIEGSAGRVLWESKTTGGIALRVAVNDQGALLGDGQGSG